MCVCVLNLELCVICHIVQGCVFLPLHRDTNSNPAIWIILLLWKKWKWTAPNSPLGDSSKSGKSKTGWLTKIQTILHNLDFCLLWKRHRKCQVVQKVIFAGLLCCARTVTHPRGLLQPRSLVHLWWVERAHTNTQTHTHTQTHTDILYKDTHTAIWWSSVQVWSWGMMGLWAETCREP